MSNIKYLFSKSKTESDFVDLWLTGLIVVLGFYFLLEQPLEKIPQYHFLIENGFTSNCMGLAATSVGFFNIIRLFNIFIFSKISSILLQCCNIVICLTMFFATINNETVPVGSVFYGMVSILAFAMLLKKSI